MNDELIKEAEEDLQKERLENLWKQYGHFVIGAIALLVILTGTVSFYGYWSLKTSQTATARINVIDINLSADKVLSAYQDILPRLPAKQALVTSLLTASKALENNPDDAKEFFEQAIQNKSGDPLLRDYARINYAALLMRDENTGFDDIHTVLIPVLKESENIWNGHASLYYALAQANLNNDYSSALATLKSIEKKKNPMPQIIQLAQALSTLYESRAEKEQ